MKQERSFCPNILPKGAVLCHDMHCKAVTRDAPFSLSTIRAGTLARFIPAVSRFHQFLQVHLHDSYLRFLASLIFHRYKPPNRTCTFSLSSLPAGTPTQFIPAISRFHHLPQVQAAQSYLPFLASLIFRRYKPLAIPALSLLPFFLLVKHLYKISHRITCTKYTAIPPAVFVMTSVISALRAPLISG